MKRDRPAAPPEELLPGTPGERARADALRAARDAAGVEVRDRGSGSDVALRPGHDLTSLGGRP